MSTQTIIVTRPAGQARKLIELLSANLKKEELVRQDKSDLPKILSLPLLTIIPKGDEPSRSQANSLFEHITTALRDADLAIFVSPNAIECTMHLLGNTWQDLSKKLLLLQNPTSEANLVRYLLPLVISFQFGSYILF